MLKGRGGPFQFEKGSRTLGSELADDLADKIDQYDRSAVA